MKASPAQLASSLPNSKIELDGSRTLIKFDGELGMRITVHLAELCEHSHFLRAIEPFIITRNDEVFIPTSKRTITLDFTHTRLDGLLAMEIELPETIPASLAADLTQHLWFNMVRSISRIYIDDLI